MNTFHPQIETCTRLVRWLKSGENAQRFLQSPCTFLLAHLHITHRSFRIVHRRSILLTCALWFPSNQPDPIRAVNVQYWAKWHFAHTVTWFTIMIILLCNNRHFSIFYAASSVRHLRAVSKAQTRRSWAIGCVCWIRQLAKRGLVTLFGKQNFVKRTRINTNDNRSPHLREVKRSNFDPFY